MNETLIAKLQKDLALNAIVKTDLQNEARSANATRARDIKSTLAKVEDNSRELEEHIVQLQEQDKREAAADAARPRGNGGGTYPYDQMMRTGYERGGTYRDPHEDPTSPSFFRDMRNARLGDWQAADRLSRNEQERAWRPVRAT